MDDEQVLLARQVAIAAAAWMHARTDSEAYRRLVLATAQWVSFCAPRLDEEPADEIAAQLRRAARVALRVMDEDAAVLATEVADAAAAWLQPPGDGAAYDHLVATVANWTNYSTPQLPDPDVEELLDQLAEDLPPVSIGQAVAEVTAHLRPDTRLTH